MIRFFKFTFYSFLCLKLLSTSLATRQMKCNPKDYSQTMLNICASQKVKILEKQLEELLRDIRLRYQGKTSFLKKLEIAQKQWKIQIEADLSMIYPKVNETGFYGSVLSLCISSFYQERIKKRMSFLKTWLQDCKEGETCMGSRRIKSSPQNTPKKQGQFFNHEFSGFSTK